MYNTPQRADFLLYFIICSVKYQRVFAILIPCLRKIRTSVVCEFCDRIFSLIRDDKIREYLMYLRNFEGEVAAEKGIAKPCRSLSTGGTSIISIIFEKYNSKRKIL